MSLIFRPTFSMSSGGVLLWEMGTAQIFAILPVHLYPPQQILQQEQGDLI